MTNIPVDRLMPPSELAEHLGVRRTALNNWINRDDIGFPEHKEQLGKYKFYDIEEVERWHELWHKATKNVGKGRSNGKRTSS